MKTAILQAVADALTHRPYVGMIMTCNEVRNVPDTCYGVFEPVTDFFEEIHEITDVTWMPTGMPFEAMVTTRLVHAMDSAASTLGPFAERFRWIYKADGVANSNGTIRYLSMKELGEKYHACLIPATKASLDQFTRSRFCVFTGAFEAREEYIDAIPTTVMAAALEAIDAAALKREAAAEAARAAEEAAATAPTLIIVTVR